MRRLRRTATALFLILISTLGPLALISWDPGALPSSLHRHSPLALTRTSISQSPRLTGFSPQDNYDAVLQLRIAVVEPVFTATAYSTSAFYDFYTKYLYTPPNRTVTTDLNLLNVSLVYDWRWSRGLWNFLNSSAAANRYNLILGRNLFLLTDVNVTEGALFAADGTRNFDAAILGFTEYVTAQEYEAYRDFVATGGTLILMDASNFYAEVAYYPQTQHLALVRGHSWRFNGTAAWRDVNERWQTENTNWVGSNYWNQVGNRYYGALSVDNNQIGKALRDKFGSRLFRSYLGHEENYLTNLTATSVIAHWVHFSWLRNHIVASYMHRWKLSHVIHLGVMGSDVVQTDVSVQYFLAQSVLFVADMKAGIASVRYYRDPSPATFFVSSLPSFTIFNSTLYNHMQIGNFAYGSGPVTSYPLGGYSFRSWTPTGGVAVMDPFLSSTTLVVTGPGNLTANLIPRNVIISFFTSTKNGNLMCGNQTGNHTYIQGESGTFPPNSTLTCMANPPSGFIFTSWSGLANSTTNPITLNTQEGGSLIAYFTSRFPLTPAAALLAVLTSVSATRLVSTRLKPNRRNRRAG